jgi:lantibiotic biosynthesis protein
MTTTIKATDQVATVRDALLDPTVVGPSPDGRTRPQSLAGGAVGVALLHVELAISGHGDEALAHRWIRAAASEPVSIGRNSDPFHGAPALAFMLHTARPLGGYHRAFASLTDATMTLVRQRLAAAHDRIDRREPLPMYEFDLVHGLTGLGLYLLHAHPDHPLSGDVVGYLTRITQPLDGDKGKPPWWLPSNLAGVPHPDFPEGHGNLGTAHGISAVIFLLAYAILHGHNTSAAHNALSTLTRWTDAHRQDDVTPGTEPTQHRPSWCYGTAGTARAQQLAGIAQNDTVRQQLAENAMLAVLQEPSQRDRLNGIGLCHGKAGLLQSASRMAAAEIDEIRSAQISAYLPGLAADLASQLAEEEHGNPELLDGTAGAALALHTFANGAPATNWDAFLALS